jgi:two-component system, chemotaxis family, sensor kinase CheA
MARDPYKYFRVEARELADELGQGLLELERSGRGAEIVPRLLRLAHTLKGAARVVSQAEIADHAHAIEGALSPLKEIAGVVPRENVDTILRLIDGITERVAALQAPEPPEGADAPRAKTTQATEEALRVVRTDVAEIDDLLDGVAETHTQMSVFHAVGGLAEKARRLSDHLAEQLGAAATREIGGAAAGGADRFAASAEVLRGVIGQLERGIAATHTRVDRELSQVRHAAEQLRLVPAGALFPNFERTVRDSAQALGKEVVFEGQGGDIRLDAHVVHVVQDAVLQILRNAVAHGVEPPPGRIAASKPPRGRVGVTVLRRGRQVVFRCDDDGCGIDVAALRAAAIRKGRVAADLDKLDANGLVHLLLQSGVSTSAAVTEVAGRGIGMDIVRAAVARLAGDLVVATEPGKGTRFELIVPLSVSSVEALVIEGGGVTATLPLYAVHQTLRLEAGQIHCTALGEAIVHDGRAIPLVSLARLLGRGNGRRRGGGVSAVVVTAPTGLAAVGVDRLLGTSNTVFRSLPELAPAAAIVAGASFDAAGNPLLMLDPEGLVASALRAGEPQAEQEQAKRPLLVIDDSLTTRMLEQSILESAGYEVDLATSGEEGLEWARRTDYALILVDVEMPGIDGFTFIEQIRRDPRLHDTPAILITSRNTPDDKRRGQEVGAQGYVVKSEFDQAELLNQIKQLVA